MFLYDISNRPSDTPSPPDPRALLIRNALRGFAHRLILCPRRPLRHFGQMLADSVLSSACQAGPPLALVFRRFAFEDTVGLEMSR